MILSLVRLNDNGIDTIGAIFIDGEYQCRTLEDTYRNIKIKGITRIPSGVYNITLRKEGGFNERYKNSHNNEIKDIHKGMLWIRNIPDFEYVYIHIGNWAKDTSGCVLVGDDYYIDNNGNRMVINSTKTYIDLYKKVSKAIIDGEDVKILILDTDRI